MNHTKIAWTCEKDVRRQNESNVPVSGVSVKGRPSTLWEDKVEQLIDEGKKRRGKRVSGQITEHVMTE